VAGARINRDAVKLTDQLLLVAVVAVAVFLAREGVEFHRRGFERSEIVIVVGTVVSLDLIVGVVVVVLMRRWNRARAESPVK
jgi:hypothetical protein